MTRRVLIVGAGEIARWWVVPLLARPDVELVGVADPDEARADVLRLATASELPWSDGLDSMTTTVEDALALVETARKTGRQLSAMQNRRYLPPVRLLRRLVECGELGEVRESRSTCSSRTRRRART